MQVDSALFQYADDFALVHHADDEDLGKQAQWKKPILAGTNAVAWGLRRIHENLGHASLKLMGQILARTKAPAEVLQLVKDMNCKVCDEWKRPKTRRSAGALGVRACRSPLLSLSYTNHTKQ